VKRIYAAATLVEAHLLKQLLAQAGVDTHVFNENAQSGVGEIPFTHAYPELWVVDDNDHGKATQFLREYERSRVFDTSRICWSCSETNPTNFGSCWNCGAVLK